MRSPESTMDPMVRRRETMTLLVCCSCLFMLSLDNTVLNVALPSLQRSFHATTSQLQWAADAYLIGRASTLFLSGSISDRYGRLRMFNIGQVGFVSGSIACALAPNLDMLIFFRVLQSLGSSLMTPSSLAIVTNTFTTRERRAWALGIWSATTGVSTAAGPVIGGFLVTDFGWRSVFWVNVPIGAAALIATRFYLSESKAAQPRPFDIPGQAAIGLGLFGLTYALITGPDLGWRAAQVEASLAVAAACAVAFLVIEKRVRNPLLELSDFKNPPLPGAVLLAVFAFIGLGGISFFNTLYLQEVRGFTPFKAGLTVLPLTAVTLFFAPLSGRMTGRHGPRRPALIAALLMTTAMAFLAVEITPTTPILILLVGYLIQGSGSGLVNTPITNSAVSGMPRERAGVASATTATARQVGVSLGIALIGSVVFSVARIGNHLTGRPGHPVAPEIAQRFAHGMTYGYATGAMLCAFSVAICAWAFRPKYIRIEQARQDAAEHRPGTPSGQVSEVTAPVR